MFYYDVEIRNHLGSKKSRCKLGNDLQYCNVILPAFHLEEGVPWDPPSCIKPCLPCILYFVHVNVFCYLQGNLESQVLFTATKYSTGSNSEVRIHRTVLNGCCSKANCLVKLVY